MSGHVTFHNAGRLGNYLMECATAMSYALKHGMPFSAPTTSRPGHPCYFQHLVDPAFDPSLPSLDIYECGYEFQNLPFFESYRATNVVIQGYRQSPLYFNAYRDKIIEAFALAKYPLLINTVSIHVRKTDYDKIRNAQGVRKHPEVTVEWIRRAMEMFPDHTFEFFSDDIGWCKLIFGSDERCGFSEGQSELDDLNLMTHCAHHINSASTFSWWAAYLGRNPQRRVICPNFWLSPGWDGPLLEDVIPSDILNWEKMS